MSSFDGQDLGQQIDRALATIAAGPVPTATIVARGRRIRRRRRAAWAGAVAVVAVLGVAIWARCTRLCAAGPWVRRSGS